MSKRKPDFDDDDDDLDFLMNVEKVKPPAATAAPAAPEAPAAPGPPAAAATSSVPEASEANLEDLVKSLEEQLKEQVKFGEKLYFKSEALEKDNRRLREWITRYCIDPAGQAKEEDDHKFWVDPTLAIELDFYKNKYFEMAAQTFAGGDPRLVIAGRDPKCEILQREITGLKERINNWHPERELMRATIHEMDLKLKDFAKRLGEQISLTNGMEKDRDNISTQLFLAEAQLKFYTQKMETEKKEE
jgi:hypothetical protein